MNFFLAALRVHLKTIIHYRGSFVVTLVMDPLFFLLNVFLVSSIYRYNQTEDIAGYSMTQMLWYFAAISFTWYFIYNSTDVILAEKIVSGALISELQKPVSVFQNELASALAVRIVGIVLNLIPSLMLYSVISFPHFLTCQALLKYVVVASFAFLIYYEFSFLVGLACLIITSNYSLQSIKYFIVILTTGAVVPLDFFPSWFTDLLKFLPFQYLFYWPCQIFLNRHGFDSGFLFLKIILVQTFWCILMYGLCRFFWWKAVKRFCGVGG